MLSRRSFLELSAVVASAGLTGTAQQALAQGSDQALLPLLTASRQSGAAATAAKVSFVPPKPATAITRMLNEAVLGQLPFDDTQDFDDAARGLIAELPNNGVIPNPDPTRPLVWNLPSYAFLETETAPASANPSLWRQARLNMYNGLFEVVPGIYQVRGADMTNMTIIEGKKGIIVIDPLVSCEAAHAALALYQQERDPDAERPVKAVIYTHTHTDHYGGVRGVVDEADVRAGKVEILAPDHFLEKVCSENVSAGTAMSRRSLYSYGTLMPRGIFAQLDVGLGKAMSLGTISLIPPTDTIVKTGERRKIDGVEIIFQLTPDAEAPAEMMMFYPTFRALNSAEVACALLHNLYTPRGAELRDAAKWAWYLDEAIEVFGADTDVVFAQHNLPTFGHEAAIQFLKHQRDLYKYLHDQTLHLANQGLNMNEIAEELSRNRRLPASLDQEWHNRSYYGTVSHNVKAVYQKYLGWYDSNPAHLELLPPVEAGKRYVAFMGGANNVIDQAQAAFNAATSADDYRWVAEVMSHVVFAEPANQAARNLAADALEQLGYQAESAIWRNQYLTGAYELRNGPLFTPGSGAANADTIRAMPIGLFFDYLGVRLNALLAEGKHIVLNWTFTDTGDKYCLNLENSALTYRPEILSPTADASLTLARTALDTINTAVDPQQALLEALQSGAIQVTGNAQKIGELFAMLDTFSAKFNLIEP